MARDPLVSSFLQTLLLTLYGFSDTDWASNPNDCTSTDVFLIFLGAKPISWSSTKQCTIAYSSTEAEYRAIVAAVAELQWVKSLLLELLVPVQLLLTLFSDNLGATYLSTNIVFYSCMKYLAIGYHFVHDPVPSSEMRIVHVSTSNQLTNALIKPLFRSCLFYLYNKICVIYDILS